MMKVWAHGRDAFDTANWLDVAFHSVLNPTLGRTKPGNSMLDQTDTSQTDGPIAQIIGLRVEFQTKDGPVLGVEDVSFSINAGETVCVVGESGSGKSVSSLSLMRLVEFGGGELAGGELLFDRKDAENVDLAKTDPGMMRSIRGNEIGMIFQVINWF